MVPWLAIVSFYRIPWRENVGWCAGLSLFFSKHVVTTLFLSCCFVVLGWCFEFGLCSPGIFIESRIREESVAGRSEGHNAFDGRISQFESSS